jgi:hypothetical protein
MSETNSVHSREQPADPAPTANTAPPHSTDAWQSAEFLLTSGKFAVLEKVCFLDANDCRMARVCYMESEIERCYDSARA